MSESEKVALRTVTADYYRKWSVRFGADGVIEIQHVGTAACHTAEGWINLATGAYPESKHIKAMVAAIHWHFGPSDAAKIMDRYLRTVNIKQQQAGDE